MSGQEIQGLIMVHGGVQNVHTHVVKDERADGRIGWANTLEMADGVRYTLSPSEEEDLLRCTVPN